MPEKRGKIFDGTDRRPLDPTAAMVGGPAPKLPPTQKEFRYYKGIETTSLPQDMKSVPDTITDYTGLRRGKLTVIGYIKFRYKSGGRKKSGAKKKLKIFYWQVRCDCGRYESRTNVVLRAPAKYEYSNQCAFCLKKEQTARNNALMLWHPGAC